MRCCLCGEKNIGHGHNAQPLKDGRCCDACNIKVVNSRLLQAFNINESDVIKITLYICADCKIYTELPRTKCLCGGKDIREYNQTVTL